MKISSLVGLIALSCSFLAVSDAFAERRPGTIAKHSAQHLTQARNSLSIVSGPLHASMFGSRVGNQSVFDGGYQLIRPKYKSGAGSTDIDPIHQYNMGVMFGVFDNLEAGALFVPLSWSPDFSAGNIHVAFTYSQMYDSFDIGFRFNFNPPLGDDANWELNPGVPLLVRLGESRIDAALYVPMEFADTALYGLNVPVRYSFNFTPAIFAGVESGFYTPDFSGDFGSRVPAGIVAGYTLLKGGSLYDITTSFGWDDLGLMGVDALDSFQPESFRFAIGLTVRKMVM